MAKTSIKQLPGLGPKTADTLLKLDIDTVDKFLAADPFEIYRQLKLLEPSTSLNFLYAMIGAQENRHWQEVKQERKTEILMRLDDMGLAPK